MVRWLGGILASLFLIAGSIFIFLSDSDLPKAALIDKYGGPEARFLDLNEGGRAHYRDQGQQDGLPILFIHGSSASLHTWQSWVGELSDAFRLVSVDLPGHGLTGPVSGNNYSMQSMTEFVNQVASGLGLDRFAIAGNSMGGNVAWHFALTYPDKVSHLILLDASGVPYPKEQEDLPLAFRIARTPIIGNAMIWFTPKRLVESGLKKAVANSDLITPDMVTRYHELARFEGSRKANLIRFRQSYDLTDVDRLSEISAPTLILWGSLDTLVPVAAAHVYDHQIIDSTLIVYEQIGHLPMEEIPQQSAADVRAFLQK